MPWLVNEGKTFGYAQSYYSNVGGSLLDYLWLASGSPEYSFGCDGNDCSIPITDNNIFRLLNNQGLSWKLYAQSYLNAGGKVTTPDSPGALIIIGVTTAPPGTAMSCTMSAVRGATSST